MSPVLTIRAGPRALAHIRREGLQARDIGLVPGAAGGPKALGLSGLDRAIFGEWLPSAPRVRHLVGASIGAWRFAAACCQDSVRLLEAFARAYTEQRYPPGASARYVSESARAMLKGLFEGREAEILSSPGYRLHVVAVRGRWPLTRDTRFGTPLGFALAALANTAGRRYLARFIDRIVFHDPRDCAACFSRDGFDPFDTHAVALDRGNLGEALVASASIPFVLEGVTGIPGAPAGVYWDGGIVDYHLHLPYHRANDLVLYPHFVDHIVPGWLDKSIPWRRARGQWLENVVLVAPSPDYVSRLPAGRLPSRQDFKRLDDDTRLRHWRAAIGESERLAEAFLRFAGKPEPSIVKPL
jgi:hypothetical protein